MAIRDQKSFPDEGRFYKGNLHCHSTHSDGKGTPEERIKEYRSAGYDFLAITCNLWDCVSNFRNVYTKYVFFEFFVSIFYLCNIISIY